MNELQVFNNVEFGSIRTIEMNGKVMFCGKDIASALGYSIPSKAVNTHCKGVSKMEVPTNGGSQEMLFITEGDIYRLITKSKLPSAEKFESWVFDEVLPSIRKTGSYKIMDSYLIDDPIKRAERWIEEQKHTLALTQKVAEQKPKADYYDSLIDCEHLTNIRNTAKELGIREKLFVNWLLDNKYLYRDANRVLRPYANRMKYFAEKDFKSKNGSHTDARTLVTVEGKSLFNDVCSGLKGV